MNGIDIASHQSGINLMVVPGDFVIVKATQSTGYVNPDFKRAFEQGLAAGKRMGIYHYAGGGNPQREARHFLNIARPYIGKAILCLDWERTQNASFGYGDDAWCKSFLDYVRAETGVTGFLYISAGYIPIFKQTLLTYNLWAAQYPDYNPIHGYDETPWNEHKDYECDIRQYTSMLFLPGWNHRLDGNKAYITGEEWDKLCGASAEEPDDEPEHLDIDDLAQEVLNGRWGNGAERRERLEAAGYDYGTVQARVNALLADDDISAIAQAVIRGDYGNGEERKRRLGAKYDAVQKRVNKILGF